MADSDNKEALGVGCTGAWVTFLIAIFVVGFQRTSIINSLVLVAPVTYGVARVVQLISRVAPISLPGLLAKTLLMAAVFAFWIYVARHSDVPFWQWF